MNAVPAPKHVDRTDPAALFELIQDEYEAIDLTEPLPKSVSIGIAIGKSNGDGIEAGDETTRLMVLANRGTITTTEAISVMLFLTRR